MFRFEYELGNPPSFKVDTRDDFSRLAGTEASAPGNRGLTGTEYLAK
jgi:hypothetical protein